MIKKNVLDFEVLNFDNDILLPLSEITYLVESNFRSLKMDIRSDVLI